MARHSEYSQQAAMSIYAYQPERALSILDSAVIMGNLDKVLADQCRARVYSMSQMHEQLDSSLGGPKEVRLDTARAIGERLLKNETIKADLKRQKDVLEVLAYTERMNNDTAKWLQRSSELVNVCNLIGDDASTDALRTKAEIGAALYATGQQERGMAMIDSVIGILDRMWDVGNGKKGFEELDALIIALKRKILLLSSDNRFVETIPLSTRILDWLDKYEQFPDNFHDGSTREPKDDESRADYIAFYRNQALNQLITAYASLGEKGNMLTAFEKLGSIIREVTAREHLARYNALQQQMEAERQQANTHRATIIIISIGILLLISIAFVVFFALNNRAINRKNRLLAIQIAKAVNYKNMYWDEKKSKEISSATDTSKLTDEQFFQHINEIVIRERLFLDPNFERQTIMDRFGLSKERVGAIFSKGSEYAKISSYIQQLRLEYAAKLLVEQPNKSVKQIAAESGFSSHTYFSGCFRKQFDVSPTDFREKLKN